MPRPTYSNHRKFAFVDHYKSVFDKIDSGELTSSDPEFKVIAAQAIAFIGYSANYNHQDMMHSLLRIRRKVKEYRTELRKFKKEYWKDIRELSELNERREELMKKLNLNF